MHPPMTILCVECGGVCHLLQPLDADEAAEAGDVHAYRCEECMERFDVVFEPEEGDEG